MKKLVFIIMCLFFVSNINAFTSIQYNGCSFSKYISPIANDDTQVFNIDRGIQVYVHHEPCTKSVAVRENSLFRHQNLIQKSSYVTCERVQGTNNYSCDRTDLSNKVFENPRHNLYSYTSRFTKGFN